MCVQETVRTFCYSPSCAFFSQSLHRIVQLSSTLELSLTRSSLPQPSQWTILPPQPASSRLSSSAASSAQRRLDLRILPHSFDRFLQYSIRKRIAQACFSAVCTTFAGTRAFYPCFDASGASGPHCGSGRRCIAPKIFDLRSGYCVWSCAISSLTS